MANRALAAKVERAARERREFGRLEFSKAFYAGNVTLAAGEAERAATSALIAAYKGKVTVCKPGAHVTPQGAVFTPKGKGSRATPQSRKFMLPGRAAGGQKSCIGW